jgi:hypothetical protein
MDTAAMMQLCESFGLDVHASYGEVADLVEALRSDRAVMVGLDAHEIWDSADDDTSDLGGDDNHAVVVTGIDLSNGLVYLNDPGTPEGQGSVVPLGQFEDAWADSGKDMIVTDFAEDQAAASVELDTLPSDTTPQATTAGVELGVVPPTTAADTTVDLGVLATQEPRHSSLPEGAAGLVLLPFTFVARIADVVRPED